MLNYRTLWYDRYLQSVRKADKFEVFLKRLWEVRAVGMYLNPGNRGFAVIRNDTYMDKSGLIGLINETIDTPRRLMS